MPVRSAYALLNRRAGSSRRASSCSRPAASIETVIDTLVDGKTILHAITIPEGLTSEQIVGDLNDERRPGRRHRRHAARRDSLLPDTYKFERGMTRQQIVNAMQADAAAAPL